MINVQPADHLRRAFARWAVAQTPRVETSGADTSAVPEELFKLIPEELLVGSRVDGTLYRHVVESLVPDGKGYKPAPAGTWDPKWSSGPVTAADDESGEAEVTPVPEPTPPVRRTRKSSIR